jgi:AcrR family transcriptional regulator
VPRRLPRELRRDQLVAAATPILARQGFADYSLDEIAARAGVTRNLLYHYFPRGRPDVTLAVVERAGRQLTDGWVVDEALPLAERLAANFERITEHALAPTHVWRIHRQARAAADPELREVVSRFADVVIASVSQNHLGTSEPPPLVHLALTGYLAFAEAVLDETRSTKPRREALMEMLTRTLVATIAAATAVDRSPGNLDYRQISDISVSAASARVTT